MIEPYLYGGTWSLRDLAYVVLLDVNMWDEISKHPMIMFRQSIIKHSVTVITMHATTVPRVERTYMFQFVT